MIRVISQKQLVRRYTWLVPVSRRSAVNGNEACTVIFNVPIYQCTINVPVYLHSMHLVMLASTAVEAAPM